MATKASCTQKYYRPTRCWFAQHAVVPETPDDPDDAQCRHDQKPHRAVRHWGLPARVTVLPARLGRLQLRPGWRIRQPLFGHLSRPIFCLICGFLNNNCPPPCPPGSWLPLHTCPFRLTSSSRPRIYCFFCESRHQGHQVSIFRSILKTLCAGEDTVSFSVRTSLAPLHSPISPEPISLGGGWQRWGVFTTATEKHTKESLRKRKIIHLGFSSFPYEAH